LDLKPENILLENNYSFKMKVIDMGLNDFLNIRKMYKYKKGSVRLFLKYFNIDF
jgi:hypothetical protein